jgi:hypothetical protein
MTSLTRKKNDLSARLAKDGPRKMLAIDGDGIRGVISLKILQPRLPKKSGAGSTTFLVDEYQDTNRLQSSILLGLMSGGLNWFGKSRMLRTVAARNE